MRLLIKNGTLADPGTEREGRFDILVGEDGCIEKIAPEIPGESISAEGELRVIDASGLTVAPGLIDVHVHFRDPGFPDKEDILTGAAAAAKGGYTGVVMMANTKPCVDTTETLSYMLEKGKTTPVRVYACANVTCGMKGQELTDMEALKEAGAVGFTDDGLPLLDEALVKKAMERTAALGVPISFHEEDPELISENGINAGKAAEYFGIKGSPREAETSLIRRDIRLARGIEGVSLDIQHISTAEGVELVRAAKSRGMNIHAEATPHHFTLTQEDAMLYGTLAKMNPPLRTEEDRLAIAEGLRDGTIDLIATDHAPHTAEEKSRSITRAPSGIIGLETALGLGITQLVEEGVLSLMDLIRCMSTNPAKVYHLPGGKVAEGEPADLVLFDANRTWEVGKTFASKAVNSPFVGWELRGLVMMTMVGGKTAYAHPDMKDPA